MYLFCHNLQVMKKFRECFFNYKSGKQNLKRFWKVKLRSWNLENSSSLAALLFLLQSPNLVWLFGTPWTAARQTSLSFTISWSLLKSCPLSWWCHPTISFSVVPFSSYPQTSPTIKVFSNELALCIRWSKYWSLSFSISPSNVYSGMMSFRIDWFYILEIQGTLRSLH